MKELLNISHYDSFDPINEMMEGYKEGGMVLIYGKKLENDEKRLFIVPIKNVIHSPRERIGGKEGSPAKMVILQDDTYRIEMDSSGDFTTHKISGRDKALGISGNKIALNKNKTPYHWESTKYQSMGKLLKEMGPILKSMPEVRWKN